MKIIVRYKWHTITHRMYKRGYTQGSNIHAIAHMKRSQSFPNMWDLEGPKYYDDTGINAR